MYGLMAVLFDDMRRQQEQDAMIQYVSMILMDIARPNYKSYERESYLQLMKQIREPVTKRHSKPDSASYDDIKNGVMNLLEGA